jgi:transposase
MPKPYSVDLRERAIALIDAGQKVSQVAELFLVAPNTVRNWLILRKETKGLFPKEGYQKGHSHKIIDLETFKKFADAHSGETLEMMAQALGNTSDTTVGRMMKKIGYTRKKRHLDIKKGMKKSVSNSLQK